MKNQDKKFKCLCQKSYDRNSSLFNHIKLKHNNDKEQYNITEVKVGRPEGQKNYKKNSSRIPAKLIKCKCGKVLKGEGSFSNHVRIKHKNDPYYQIQKKQQGRKRRITTNDIQQGFKCQDTLTTACFSTQMVDTEQCNYTLETENVDQGHYGNSEQQIQQGYLYQQPQLEEQIVCSGPLSDNYCYLQNSENDYYYYYNYINDNYDCFNNNYEF